MNAAIRFINFYNITLYFGDNAFTRLVIQTPRRLKIASINFFESIIESES